MSTNIYIDTVEDFDGTFDVQEFLDRLTQLKWWEDAIK